MKSYRRSVRRFNRRIAAWRFPATAAHDKAAVWASPSGIPMPRLRLPQAGEESPAVNALPPKNAQPSWFGRFFRAYVRPVCAIHSMLVSLIAFAFFANYDTIRLIVACATIFPSSGGTPLAQHQPVYHDDLPLQQSFPGRTAIRNGAAGEALRLSALYRPPSGYHARGHRPRTLRQPQQRHAAARTAGAKRVCRTPPKRNGQPRHGGLSDGQSAIGAAKDP